jgi:hypothetical protein
LFIFVKKKLLMINSVRNTVLAILNKNNYGYISPQDFNLFAKQAQLDIFEDYFYQYNYQVNKENKRLSGTGYADIKKGYEEVIDLFAVNLPLQYVGTNVFLYPSQATTGSDYYFIDTVLYSPSLGAAGISSSDFVVVEKVSNSKISLLRSSLLTSPTDTYPAYVGDQGSAISIYGPDVANLAQNAIWCQYIRYPRDPQWTYTTLTGGEPVFNQSNPSYQDFELPLDDEPSLVMKILQFAGMSIREIQAVQFGQATEQYEDNQEK